MLAGNRKRVILTLLRSHLGPERAITAGEIAEMVFGDRGNDRTVRSIIAELIVQDGHGEILANTGGEAFTGCPAGYFWASDWRQADAYYNVLISRREDIGHRAGAAWAARQRLQAAPREQMQFGREIDLPLG